MLDKGHLSHSPISTQIIGGGGTKIAQAGIGLMFQV